MMKGIELKDETKTDTINAQSRRENTQAQTYMESIARWIDILDCLCTIARDEIKTL